MLLLAFLLLIEIPVLFVLIRRSGFSPFPHINLIYFVGAQVAIAAMSADLVEYNFVRLFTSGAYKKHYTEVLLSFAMLFFVFAMAFRVPRAKPIMSTLRSLRTVPTQGLGLGIATVSLVAFHLVLFALIDWPKAWYNEDYLLMGSPEMVRYSQAAALILSYKVVGLATVALTIFLQVRRRWQLFMLLAPFSAFDILYQLSAHSRAVALYLAMAGSAHYVLTRKSRPLIISSLLAVFSLVLCLGGRRYGVQGFSSLPLSGEMVRLYLSVEPFAIFINFFEGAFASAEMFSRTFDANPRYAMLSFSPLVSFIDGYEAVRMRHQYHFATFFPPPAIFELRSFPWPYTVLYTSVQIIAGLMTLRLQRKSPSLLALALNILMAFAVYAQFTYTVRHVFRLFLLVVGVSLLANAALAFNKQSNNQNRLHHRRPGHDRQPDFRPAKQVL